MKTDPLAESIAARLTPEGRRPARWVIFVVLGVVVTLVLLALSVLSQYQLIEERHQRYIEDQARRTEVVSQVNVQVCDILNYVRDLDPSAKPPDAKERQLRQHIACPYPATLTSEEPTP